MRFGKIELTGESIRYKKLTKPCEIPVFDILWAYQRIEEVSAKMCCSRASFDIHSVIVVTQDKKTFKFEMEEREAKDFLRELKACNPDISVGCPKGTRIALSSLPNTRDLGGMATEDGLRVLPGRLLRSGALAGISEEDQKILLREYHLKTVIDFRTDTERAEQPDPELEGVLHVDNPIAEEETMGITRDGKGIADLLELERDPDELMMDVYLCLVRDELSKQRYARFFEYLLAQEEGAILWHCSAGKDRVGIGTMLLLSALGVPESVIRKDYLRTNTYLQKTNEGVLAALHQKFGATEEQLAKLRLIFETREEFLDSALTYIKREYGSVKKYLEKELGITGEKRRALKELYLCAG